MNAFGNGHLNWILHVLFNSNITLYFEHHIQITISIADKPTLIIHQYPQVILKTYLSIHIFLKHFVTEFQKKTMLFLFGEHFIDSRQHHPFFSTIY